MRTPPATARSLVRELDAAPPVPTLHCPFASSIHPAAEDVNTATVAWARAVGLVDARSAPRLEAQAIGGLVARAYPRGARGPLQLAADWTTFFCLLDDWIERLPSAAAVARALAGISAALAGEAPVDGPSLEVAAADLGRRFAAVATRARRARFEARVRELFEAFVVEAEARAAGRPPAPAAYLPIREITVGIHVELEIGELVEGIELSPEARARAERAGLARSASNLVGWANDLHTYEKELRAGETMNLVAVLAEAEGLDLRAAVTRAAPMHDDEACVFARRAADLGGDEALARYAAMLRAWVRGHLDWAHATGRYRPDGGHAGGGSASRAGGPASKMCSALRGA
jgi:hypothetical protein